MAVGKTARRLLAALGVAALGVTAMAGAASADIGDQTGELDLDSIVQQDGSITINKYTTPGGAAQVPLVGVEFDVQEVLYNDEPIDLTTAEGWQLAQAAYGLTLPSGDYTLGAATSVATGPTGSVTVNVPHLGLYLVTETGSGNNLITGPAEPYLVTIPFPRTNATGAFVGWLYDVDTYPKNELGDFTFSKQAGDPVDENGDPVASGEGLVPGAIVPFTLTLTIPQSDAPYNSVSITDTLGAGLAFDSYGAISFGTYNSDDNAEYFEILTPPAPDAPKVSLTDPGLDALNALAAVGDVTFTVVINAEVTDLGILTNSAEGEINGNTRPGTDTTNYGGLEVTKVDSEDNEVTLAGAEFELYAADKTTKIGEATTDENGVISFWFYIGTGDEVGPVTVWLKETKAPTGYVLPADPWFGAYEVFAGQTTEGSITLDTVPNYKPEGPEIPLTGANGAMLLTIGGLALVGLGAGTVLVTRSRRNAA